MSPPRRASGSRTPPWSARAPSGLLIGLALVVGWSLADGLDGFLGALVGLVMVGVFYGSDIYLMRKTVDLVPVAVFAVMAMAFTLKLTLLAIFLVVLKDTTAFSVPAFATTVIVLTSVGLFVAVWLSARTTTVLEPDSDGADRVGGDA